MPANGFMVSLALIHYPVYNKGGDVIASAVSNLDLHDIARAAKTYGVENVYVVTPLLDQQSLVKRIVGHWTAGAGGRYNPDRKKALELIRLAGCLDEVITALESRGQGRPIVVVTDARPQAGSIGFSDCYQMLKSGRPVLMLFGTAWGLAHPVIRAADYILEPIFGPTDYNHLPVRSAVAVVLDRFFGH